jgi:hypothetical protein
MISIRVSFIAEVILTHSAGYKRHTAEFVTFANSVTFQASCCTRVRRDVIVHNFLIVAPKFAGMSVAIG